MKNKTTLANLNAALQAQVKSWIAKRIREILPDECPQRIEEIALMVYQGRLTNDPKEVVAQSKRISQQLYQLPSIRAIETRVPRGDVWTTQHRIVSDVLKRTRSEAVAIVVQALTDS